MLSLRNNIVFVATKLRKLENSEECNGPQNLDWKLLNQICKI